MLAPCLLRQGRRVERDRRSGRLDAISPDEVRHARHVRCQAEIGTSGREMTKADWSDLYARHDQVMVDE
jgi:hypothetical protein